MAPRGPRPPKKPVSRFKPKPYFDPSDPRASLGFSNYQRIDESYEDFQRRLKYQADMGFGGPGALGNADTAMAGGGGGGPAMLGVPGYQVPPGGLDLGGGIHVSSGYVDPMGNFQGEVNGQPYNGRFDPQTNSLSAPSGPAAGSLQNGGQYGQAGGGTYGSAQGGGAGGGAPAGGGQGGGYAGARNAFMAGGQGAITPGSGFGGVTRGGNGNVPITIGMNYGAPQGGAPGGGANLMHSGNPAASSLANFHPGVLQGESPDVTMGRVRQAEVGLAADALGAFDNPLAQATRGSIMGTLDGSNVPYDQQVTRALLAQATDQAGGQYSAQSDLNRQNYAARGMEGGGGQQATQRALLAQHGEQVGGARRDVLSTAALQNFAAEERARQAGAQFTGAQAGNMQQTMANLFPMLDRFQITGDSKYDNMYGPQGAGGGGGGGNPLGMHLGTTDTRTRRGGPGLNFGNSALGPQRDDPNDPKNPAQQPGGSDYTDPTTGGPAQYGPGGQPKVPWWFKKQKNPADRRDDWRPPNTDGTAGRAARIPFTAGFGGAGAGW